MPLSSELLTQIRVTDAAGQEVPSQLLRSSGESRRILFAAKVPAVGLCVFHVEASSAAYKEPGGVVAGDRTIKNSRYSVRLNEQGNICSIQDRVRGVELLSGPIEVELLNNQ